VAQKIEDKNERPLQSYTLKQFLAVNTTNTRTATPDGCFYQLENAQPIGAANVHSIFDISGLLQPYGVDDIYFDKSCNIGNVEYLIQVSTSGKVFAYNVAANTLAQIGSGLSGNASRVAQFENTTALIIDPTGYYSWDGTTFSQITGNGAPSFGTCIAVFQDRVWVTQGRILYYSAPGSFTDFTTANGGGFSVLVDPILKSNVTELHATNGYLYIIGIGSVQALSDLYVPSGISPPTPTFTLLPLTGIVGTDQPCSVQDYGRLVIFANRYGVWSVVGTDVQTISSFDPNNSYTSSIDGTWQYVTFVQPISGGQFVSNALLCAGFLVQYANDPIFGSGTIVLVYQGNAAGGRWWSANWGLLTRITTSFLNGQPVLFGYKGNGIYQLFADASGAPPAKIQTGLWDFGDPITAKQVIRAGVGMSIQSSGTNAAVLTVDTQNTSNAVPTTLLGAVQWTNNVGAPVTWVNAGNQAVSWVPGVYLTFYGNAPKSFSKYVGMTLATPQGMIFELQTFLMDYKWADRWSGN